MTVIFTLEWGRLGLLLNYTWEPKKYTNKSIKYIFVKRSKDESDKKQANYKPGDIHVHKSKIHVPIMNGYS